MLPSGTKWVVRDDDQGGNLGTFDFDLSEIEETPHLRPGDLLPLRGDLIHRTQDSSTRRIAASIRYINSGTVVPGSSLVRGSFAKALMMLNARYLFDPVFACFDRSGEQTVRAGEINRYLKEIRAQRLNGMVAGNTSKIPFLLPIAKEKLQGR